MALPVTALFAGLLGLWIVFLIFVVVGFRRGSKVSLGTGDDARGERLIRAHGNAVETIPIFLILLGLAEGMGSPGWLLHATGLVFVAGRLMHGANFLIERRGAGLRVYGMIATLTALIVLALDLLRHAATS